MSQSTPQTAAAPSAGAQLPDHAWISALRRVRRPFLVCHVTPDADALGAALGLAMAMKGRGESPVVGLPDGCVADKLRFLLELAQGLSLANRWDAAAGHDALLVLDTASEKRINIEPPPDLSGAPPVFNIDHHITNTDFGRFNWVDPHASSTCELVVRLAGALDWDLSPSAASLLYAGIHGDTAGFSLPCTSASALRAAAKLVEAGADVTHIGEQLCRSQARQDFELLRRVYDHTTVAADGLIAYSFLSHDDFLATGCKPETIDDQVSIPLGLKGVRIAMLFTEGERGVVRINFRGEGRVRVLELAQQFGGGGHAQAAGVRVRNRPLQDVVRDVLGAAESYLRGQASG